MCSSWNRYQRATKVKYLWGFLWNCFVAEIQHSLRRTGIGIYGWPFFTHVLWACASWLIHTYTAPRVCALVLFVVWWPINPHKISGGLNWFATSIFNIKASIRNGMGRLNCKPFIESTLECILSGHNYSWLDKMQFLVALQVFRKYLDK